jgi:hypothetical protein
MYRDGGKCDIDVSPNSVTRRRDAHVFLCVLVFVHALLCCAWSGSDSGCVKFVGSVGTAKDG